MATLRKSHDIAAAILKNPGRLAQAIFEANALKRVRRMSVRNYKLRLKQKGNTDERSKI